MNVHIYAPPTTSERARILPCPTCKQRRKMLVLTYEWHGAFITCTGCGEQWSDGEMCPRPFARGWRQKSIDRAKRQLRKLQEKRA